MGQLAIDLNQKIQASLASFDSHAKQFTEAFKELVVRVHKVSLEWMPLIAEWSKNALIYAGTTLLFLSNSSIFVIGMCFGVVNTKTMDSMLTDIQNVAERIMKEKDFTRLALMITGGILAWPITMAASAFFMGGYYGSKLKKPYGEPDHVAL